jgi:two-component system, OmpR family, response regulator VicR
MRNHLEKKILIVEDDDSIADFLRITLESYGFRVWRAAHGADAIPLFIREDPDAVLLDLNLPGLDGTEILKQIRAKSEVPVLVVSVRNDEVDKVCALELGADDYITKPFSARELVARVKTNLRGSTRGSQIFEIEKLHIDWRRAEISRAGVRVILSSQEFDVLHHLFQNRDRVVSRSQLIEQVWGYDFDGDERTVDTTVKRLRRKIGSRLVETVRGRGYRFMRS